MDTAGNWFIVNNYKSDECDASSTQTASVKSDFAQP